MERKVKLFCSFGGELLRRPIDRNLRYVGGETRIIRISKGTSWRQLKQMTMAMYNQPHTIKYQHPGLGEDLDALVLVSCDEDVEDMMECCSVLEGGDDKKLLIRMFLCSLKDSGTVSSGQLLNVNVEFEQNNERRVSVRIVASGPSGCETFMLDLGRGDGANHANLVQGGVSSKGVSVVDQDHVVYSPLLKVGPVENEGADLGHMNSQVDVGEEVQQESSSTIEEGAHVSHTSQMAHPHLVEKVGESLEVENPVPKVEENLGSIVSEYESFATGLVNRCIVDTNVGEIDLSNIQIIKSEDLMELKEVGSGSFHSVYHGIWRDMDAAIKRIKKSCSIGVSTKQERLILESCREAGILSKLDHPNVVNFYGVVPDEAETTLAIVMEFMVNGSLKDVLLHTDGYLDHCKKLIIALDVAFGMEYLHHENIVHFGLKCKNLLVDLKDPLRPICKVGGFGQSQIKRHTLVSRDVRGALPWMAPELIEGGSSVVSEKVDVYSFGIVMWELLTGEEPYANMNDDAIKGGIMANTLRPPVPVSCDPEWRRLMDQCWASDPQKRPSFIQIASQLCSMYLASQAYRESMGEVVKEEDLKEMRKLGAGAFGAVYCGKWRGFEVAIKRINKSCFAAQSSEHERLEHERLILETWREAEMLSKFHHPNVVSFYGVMQDEARGTISIVTEFVVNGSLRNVLLHNRKYLDNWKRLIIVMGAASGMEYLHLKNIIHFDLKCDNLLVDLKDPSRPICKIGDLGLSKIKRKALVSGGIRGTLPWMAPELIRGSNMVSEKVDVYSFGIVMWEILTGEEPYANMNADAIKDGVANNKLRPHVPASCNPEWRKLMEQCWDSNPQQRPSFAQIAHQLRFMSVAIQTYIETKIIKNEKMRNQQIIKNEDLEELRELGSGTYGTVYHGKWRGMDVAIKRIKKSCFEGRSSEQERLMEFWEEVEILSQIHHPNIVAFYGVVQDGPEGTLATVTEFMIHGSLRHVLLRKEKYLDRRQRIIIAMDAAFGMEYLHSKNIVHFDLKSDNLLVNFKDLSRPICKVGDFGLSKIKHTTLVSGGVRGTLPWMAPELLNGNNNMVSEKVDVFSFGIVMWEILTGEEPYANMHYGAIIGGIVSNTLRPPVPASCDPEWQRLMEQCWAPDPQQRPSFTQIAGQLHIMSSANYAKPGK